MLANFAYAETTSQTAIDKATAANSQKTAEAHEKLNALQAKVTGFERQEQIRLAELAKKPNIKIGMGTSIEQ